MQESFVDTPEALSELCRALQGSEWLAIDTEFIRERTYYPRLCLIQVCNGEIAACIDPLQLDEIQPLLDLLFDGSVLKVLHGGWVPLLIGVCLLIVMLTWRRGARILANKTRRLETPLDVLLKSLAKSKPPRVPGTAVFLTAAPESAPTALLHSLKHYKVLHESNVILTLVTENVPRVSPQDRVKIEPLWPGP